MTPNLDAIPDHYRPRFATRFVSNPFGGSVTLGGPPQWKSPATERQRPWQCPDCKTWMAWWVPTHKCDPQPSDIAEEAP